MKEEHEITRLVDFHSNPPARDFSWSPKEYRIVYWVPEMGQIPAKIIIIEIPSRKEISTKSRHLVSDVRDDVCMDCFIGEHNWVGGVRDGIWENQQAPLLVINYLSFSPPFLPTLLHFTSFPHPPSVLVSPSHPSPYSLPLLPLAFSTVQDALAQARRLPLCEGGPLDDKKQEGI